MLDWLKEAETCSAWYRADPVDEGTKRLLERFPYIVWSHPCSLEQDVRYFQDRGVRAMCYISVYKAPDTARVTHGAKWQGSSRRAEAEQNPFWRSVDLAGRPHWIAIDENGAARRPFGVTDYQQGWEQICTNTAEYRDAALRGLEELFAWGVDGIFVDNVTESSRFLCHGPHFRAHEHVLPEKTSGETCIELLGEMYEIARGREKAVMINAFFDPRLMDKTDVLMKENFTSAGGVSWGDVGWSLRMFDELDAASGAQPRMSGIADELERKRQYLLRYAQEGDALRRDGRKGLALSYIGSGAGKDDAFYTYAMARACGWDWSDYLRCQDGGESLYGLKLGEPRGALREEAGMFVREHERGIVAANITAEARPLAPPLFPDAAGALDLYSDRRIASGEPLALPPESGRVFLR